MRVFQISRTLVLYSPLVPRTPDSQDPDGDEERPPPPSHQLKTKKKNAVDEVSHVLSPLSLYLVEAGGDSDDSSAWTRRISRVGLSRIMTGSCRRHRIRQKAEGEESLQQGRR